jgi:hypothetical protein
MSEFRVNLERRFVSKGWADVEAKDELEAKKKAMEMLKANQVYMGDMREEFHAVQAKIRK